MTVQDVRNAPLPRMRRESAEGWARDYARYLAATAGVSLDDESERIAFHDCVGRRGETPTDGRFRLTYAVTSDTPKDRFTAALRAVRGQLEELGYTIIVYREYVSAEVSAVLSARHPEGHFTIGADSTIPPPGTPERMFFSVRTCCLLPPGVPQQQV